MTNWHFQNRSLATTVIETMRFRKGSFSIGLLKLEIEWNNVRFVLLGGREVTRSGGDVGFRL